MTEVRLQKFLSQAGVASRRRAETMIKDGRVTVDRKVVRELGVKIDPDTARVTVDGKRVKGVEHKTTVVLHKPQAVLTTMKDPRERRTVGDIVQDEPYRLLPIGRLDYHTEGLLLMSTDGELANRLLHPKYKAPKVYVVKVGGHPSQRSLNTLRDGVPLEDGKTQPAVVDVLESGQRHTWLQLVLTEGRNRQVRRMCEAIGHTPLRVVRTEFATLAAPELRPGEYRYLDEDELKVLYRVAQMVKQRPPLSDRAQETTARILGRAERRKGALPGEERKVSKASPRKKRRVKKDAPRKTRGPLSKKSSGGGKPSAAGKKKAVGKPKGMRPSDYRKKTSSES